ncbi:hypothetical protein CES85_3276 (plasmid) [Ochrobactrum quorumnocens]|uniref:Uncharacterized protein n=1 Tax=Ochrobactrum quorumnocens TaxID=271865 RepID=A0A248UNS3_9HYPH|nr:hypothetical protein CES85_3276 [[Ochrobactrum] quorumnocens]
MEITPHSPLTIVEKWRKECSASTEVFYDEFFSIYFEILAFIGC